MSQREVKRVLVMLDYGSGDPDSGEVFDLTALAQEMQSKAGYSGSISLDVRAQRTYAGPEKPAVELTISWGGYAGEFVHGATHVEDVVNSALPDGERVQSLRTKAKRLRKKAEQVDRDAMVAKLIQVADVRSQHPIARVTEAPNLLEAAS